MRQAGSTTSRVADAYDLMKRRLVGGEMRLGQPISRRKLAAEFGMSFLPVSIALLRLEYEGFIESRPRAGTRVRIPSPEDIRGHYIVREALEMQAAKLFAARATAKERDGLRALAKRVDALETGPDRTRRIRTHQKFHNRIAEGARCPALARTIEGVLARESVWLSAYERPTHYNRSHRHQELADVLTERDAEKAAEAIREHIARGLLLLMEGLKPSFAQRRRGGRTFVRKEIVESS